METLRSIFNIVYIFLSMFIPIMFIGTLVWIGGYKNATFKFQREAIKHNVAEYNPTTGLFQWKQQNKNQMN